MRRYTIVMNNAPVMSGNAYTLQIGLALSYPDGAQ